jgi:hypothetical protein
MFLALTVYALTVSHPTEQQPPFPESLFENYLFRPISLLAEK